MTAAQLLAILPFARKRVSLFLNALNAAMAGIVKDVRGAL